MSSELSSSAAYSPNMATFESFDMDETGASGVADGLLDEQILSYRRRLNEMDTDISKLTKISDNNSNLDDNEDQDIQIIRSSVTTNSNHEETTKKKSMSVVVDKELRSLHRFFVFVARSRMSRAPSDADKLAHSWVHTWASAGYTYRSLLKRAQMGEQRAKKGLAPPEELPKKLWESLKALKHTPPKEVTLSFLVNRTVEHFQLVFEKRARKKKQLGLDSKDEEAIESFVEKEVRLVPLDEPVKTTSITKVAVTDVNEQEIRSGGSEAPNILDTSSNEITSSTRDSCNNNATTEATINNTVSLSAAEDAGLKIDREFRDFLWQKVSSGSSPSIQATTLTVDYAFRVLHQCDLRPQTVLSWYFFEMDQGKTPRLSALLKTKLVDVAASLPIACPLTNLINHLVDFCEEYNVDEALKTESNRSRYEEALKSLGNLEEIEAGELNDTVEVIDVEAENEDGDEEPCVVAERSLPSAYLPAIRRSRSRGASSSTSRRRKNRSKSRSSSSTGRRKKKRRSRSFDSNDLNLTKTTSLDNAYHKLPYHPMSRLWSRPLSSFSDYSLKIYCHVEAFATGPVVADLIQIAACVDGSDADNADFFAAVEVRSVSHAIQRVLNLKTTSDSHGEYQVFTKEDGKHIECKDVRRSIRSLVDFIHINLKTTKCSSAILIFGSAENAFYLLHALASIKSENLEHQFFSCVKGFCFIEPLVKSKLVRKENIRLSLQSMVNVVLSRHNSKKWSDLDERDSDTKALVVKKLFKALKKKHKFFNVNQLVLEVKNDVIDNFIEYDRRLRHLESLRGYLIRHFDERHHITDMQGLFSMYPSKVCDPEVSKCIDSALVVASIFVELLLCCGLSLSQLQSLEERSARSLIRAAVESCREVDEDNEDRLEQCIHLTTRWLSDQNEEEHNSYGARHQYSDEDLRGVINESRRRRPFDQEY